jgi:hypothetical protein
LCATAAACHCPSNDSSSAANTQTQDAASALTSLDVTQVVATSPPLDFTVTAAAASPNGHSLLLVGMAQQVCAVAGLL